MVIPVAFMNCKGYITLPEGDQMVYGTYGNMLVDYSTHDRPRITSEYQYLTSGIMNEIDELAKSRSAIA